jgi:hypothetical protein
VPLLYDVSHDKIGKSDNKKKLDDAVLRIKPVSVGRFVDMSGNGRGRKN